MIGREKREEDHRRAEKDSCALPHNQRFNAAPVQEHSAPAPGEYSRIFPSGLLERRAKRKENVGWI